ncbi:FAD-binding domain-containing protein [Apiospora saccharicola]|uniref:FAD-binding domain-containing protein n=1 Tax=Apiospora saccharicola TaxID=335842 RepID=A0ABR1VBN3_9PEZI
MVRFHSLIACGLAALPSLAAALPRPSSCPDGLCLQTRANIAMSQVQRELGALISSDAHIYGPNDPSFQNLTQRYQAYMPPKIQLVVQVGEEKDVSAVISYASRNSVEFYVVNRGHGLPVSQGTFNGIQVDVGLLRNITIKKDGKTGLFQGGTFDQQVIDYLWDRGYVTTTGSCACVGMLGPGLGGGHGRMQNKHGLISDNLVQINAVLANGTAITVSQNSHSDLFWAMQGAGHNFAAVTSFELKIYPRGPDTWYHKTYIFKQDKLEKLFALLNEVDKEKFKPTHMLNFGFYFWNQAFDTKNPVIQWDFTYIGPKRDVAAKLKPFDDLGPVNATEADLPYPEILPATGTGLDDPLCAKGLNHVVGTAGVQSYNVTTQRQIFDHFVAKSAAYPGLAGTFVVMESYGIGGVVEKDPASSAFPMRDDYLLLQTSVNYAPNATLDAAAVQWARESVDIWNRGQPTRKPTTYVNYGLGDESLESIYGYEPWRLEKLRKLKKAYDPYNKFRYYVPLIRDSA